MPATTSFKAGDNEDVGISYMSVANIDENALDQLHDAKNDLKVASEYFVKAGDVESNAQAAQDLQQVDHNDTFWHKVGNDLYNAADEIAKHSLLAGLVGSGGTVAGASGAAIKSALSGAGAEASAAEKVQWAIGNYGPSSLYNKLYGNLEGPETPGESGESATAFASDVSADVTADVAAEATAVSSAAGAAEAAGTAAAAAVSGAAEDGVAEGIAEAAALLA